MILFKMLVPVVLAATCTAKAVCKSTLFPDDERCYCVLNDDENLTDNADKTYALKNHFPGNDIQCNALCEERPECDSSIINTSSSSSSLSPFF